MAAVLVHSGMTARYMIDHRIHDVVNGVVVPLDEIPPKKLELIKRIAQRECSRPDTRMGWRPFAISNGLQGRVLFYREGSIH